MPKSKALVERLDLDYPVLVDPEMTAIRAYGVEDEGKDIARPATFIMGEDGEVRWTHVGRNPRDRPEPNDILQVVKGM